MDPFAVTDELLQKQRCEDRAAVAIADLLQVRDVALESVFSPREAAGATSIRPLFSTRYFSASASSFE